MNNIIPDNENWLMVHASSFKVPYFSKSGRSDNMFSLTGSGFSVYKGNFFVSQLNYYAQFVVHINRSMISSKYACCTLYVWSLYSSDFKILIMAKKIIHSIILFICSLCFSLPFPPLPALVDYQYVEFRYF